MKKAIETIEKYERRDLDRAKERALKNIEEENFMGAVYQLMDAHAHKYTLSMLEVLKEQEG